MRGMSSPLILYNLLSDFNEVGAVKVLLVFRIGLGFALEVVEEEYLLPSSFMEVRIAKETRRTTSRIIIVPHPEPPFFFAPQWGHDFTEELTLPPHS